MVNSRSDFDCEPLMVVECAAGQSSDSQQIRQLMVLPQSGDQVCSVGATDFFDWIKACNFLGTPPLRAVVCSRHARLHWIARRRRAVSFWLYAGPSLLLVGESLYTAFVEMTTLDHDLIGISDV